MERFQTMLSSFVPSSSNKARTVLVSCVAIATLSASAAYAAKVSDVSAESNRWMVASAESQKRVDSISEQRNDLSDKFRAT
ncbi:DUF3450 domain-containing protein, partial [Stenotrophobium rhamnosiphilum]